MIEFFVNKLLIICYLQGTYSITEHTPQNRMQSYNFFSKLPNICITKFYHKTIEPANIYLQTLYIFVISRYQKSRINTNNQWAAIPAQRPPIV